MLVALALAFLNLPDGAPVLAAPVRLQADGKDIVAGNGHAAPWLYDWDGDGKRDLLVGQYADGAMKVYKNVGEDDAPRLGKPFVFKPEGGPPINYG